MNFFGINISKKQRQAIEHLSKYKDKFTLPQNINNKSSLLKDLATRESVETYFQTGLSNILPNPDPILKALGIEQQAYDDILSDTALYGNIQQRKAGTLKLNWEINHQSSNNNFSDIINSFFHDIDIDEITREILDAPQFGYNPIEITWNYVGKYLLPLKIEAKPRDWFGFDNDNQLKLKDKTGVNFQDIPKYKILLPRHEKNYKNPYGVPLLSKCYWNAMFRREGKKFWIVFVEKYGMPWVQGSFMPEQISKFYDTDPESAATLFKDAISDMVADGVIVVPKDSTEINIQATGTKASSDIYNQLIESCKAENASLQLGHTGSSMATPGKLGNETGAMQVREDIILMDSKLVSKTYNQLIKWIFDLNFSNVTERPEFIFPEKADVKKEQAERDVNLTSAGANLSKNYFIREYNLQDDDLLEVNNELDNSKNSFENILSKVHDKFPQMSNEEAFNFVEELTNHNHE